MEEVLKDIKSNCDSISETIFLNLCDGTDDGEGGDGYPGLSLVKLLKDLGLNYTGSDTAFYECSTSKVLLKKAMLAQNVSTSAYVEIRKNTMDNDVIKAIEAVGFPLFVKLTISQSSMGISAKSICRTYEEAITQCQEIFKNDASAGGVYIEKFLAGREFTVLVAGDKARGCTVYLPIERVFNEALRDDDKILDFKTYWHGYDVAGAMPEAEARHVRYEAAPDEIQ